MPSVSRNIAANLFASVWASLLSFALIPIYVHLIGIESYGLIALLPTLQALFVPLDLGLSTTLNRELAIAAHDAAARRAAIHIVRTVEIVYWLAALLFGCSIAFAAGYLATHWVKPGALSTDTVTQAFVLIGISLIFHLPTSLYSGGLLGLQEQVKLNIILVAGATARGIAAITALYFIAPTLVVFLASQAIVTAAQTAATAYVLWRALSGSSQARFRASELRRLRAFAASMIGISTLTVLMMQLDKLILSKLLPLAQFGYYTLAASVAALVYRGVAPVYQAVFPRLCELVKRGETDTVRLVYHEATQVVVVLILPAAIVVSFFSADALLLWLQDVSTATRTADLLSVLMIGTAINGILLIPHALQLAYGWTSLALYTNLSALVVLVPAMVLAANSYGGTGAALVWAAVNVTNLIVPILIMHRRLIPGAQWSWYIYDLGRPVLWATMVAALGKGLSLVASEVPAAVMLFCTFAASFAAAALTVPVTARWMRMAPPPLRALHELLSRYPPGR